MANIVMVKRPHNCQMMMMIKDVEMENPYISCFRGADLLALSEFSIYLDPNELIVVRTERLWFQLFRTSEFGMHPVYDDLGFVKVEVGNIYSLPPEFESFKGRVEKARKLKKTETWRDDLARLFYREKLTDLDQFKEVLKYLYGPNL